MVSSFVLPVLRFVTVLISFCYLVHSLLLFSHTSYFLALQYFFIYHFIQFLLFVNFLSIFFYVIYLISLFFHCNSFPSLTILLPLKSRYSLTHFTPSGPFSPNIFFHVSRNFSRVIAFHLYTSPRHLSHSLTPVNYLPSW